MSISENNNRKLYITKDWVFIIFIYYSVLFITGTYFALKIILDISDTSNIVQSALIGSISIAVSASSIAYIRKLYKLCFKYSSEQENEDQLTLKRIGTVFYFFTRPVFAMLFSILIIVGFNSGMLASSSKVELGSGFIYITMAFSFYAGFLSGDLIKKLEKSGQKKLDKIVS